jgi:hypothetical protein
MCNIYFDDTMKMWEVDIVKANFAVKTSALLYVDEDDRIKKIYILQCTAKPEAIFTCCRMCYVFK